MGLTEKLTNIANAIREINSTTELIPLQQMPSKIKETQQKWLKWVRYGSVGYESEYGAIYNLNLSNIKNIRNYLFYETILYNCIIKPTIVGLYSFGRSSFDNSSVVDFSNLEYVCEGSFSNMSGLDEFIAPKLETVEDYTFKHSGISVLQLENATIFNTGAVSYCDKLTSLHAPNLITIKYYGLAHNDKIKTINLPNVTTLELGALSYNKALETVNIPKVAEIPVTCFMFNERLNRLDFYGNSIKAEAFKYCKLLTKLILHSTTVVKLLATDVFIGSAIHNGTGYVYVPDELVETYKTTDRWSTYSSQIKSISELPMGE